jgi:tetratricopeptide (TPR) repeat protein
VPKSLLQAQVYSLLQQPKQAGEYYEKARKFLTTKLQERRLDENIYSAMGIALAGLGRKEEGLQHAKKAVELLPVSREAYRGSYRLEDLARVYTMIGQYDDAIRVLEQLMSIPASIGTAGLMLDPTWKPLLSHPRFQELIRKHSKKQMP